MSPSSNQFLQVFGLLIVVLLIGLAFYPGTFASPYITAQDTPKYAHTIIPESSPIYEEYTDAYDPPVYTYDDLPPVAQDLFDRTRAAEPREQYNGERRFIPAVCPEFMLVCDEYHVDELPEQFTYGESLSPADALVFIEDGDDRYLFQTGWTSHGGLFVFPIRFVLTWLTVLPLAALIALVTFRGENTHRHGGAVGVGVLVVILGFLAPYSEMRGLVSARTIAVFLASSVWLGLLIMGSYWLYQRATGRIT